MKKKTIEYSVNTKILTETADIIRNNLDVPDINWDGGVIGNQLAILLDGSAKMGVYKRLMHDLIAAIQINPDLHKKFSSRDYVGEFVKLYQFFETLHMTPDVESYFHLLAIESGQVLTLKDERFLVGRYYDRYHAEMKSVTSNDDGAF